MRLASWQVLQLHRLTSNACQVSHIGDALHPRHLPDNSLHPRAFTHPPHHTTPIRGLEIGVKGPARLITLKYLFFGVPAELYSHWRKIHWLICCVGKLYVCIDVVCINSIKSCTGTDAGQRAKPMLQILWKASAPCEHYKTSICLFILMPGSVKGIISCCILLTSWNFVEAWATKL